MTYKVVPFTAKITRADSSTTVSQQVQEIIDHGVAQGYEYVGLERIETNVAPTKGCFGIGAEYGYTTTYQMLIFKK